MTSEELDDRLQTAWRQVRYYFDRRQAGTVSPADDPQPELARELYAAWCADPDAAHAGRALAAAFQMWGNAGLDGEIDRLLPFLDVHAPYWGAVLSGAERAYWKVDRSPDRKVNLLHRYEHVLTHPRSRAALLEMLGMHHWFAGEIGRARGYYEQLVGLAIDDPTCAGRAAGALYEFDNLQPGQPAPLFSGQTVTGGAFRLIDQRGKAVCIDFWSTSCGACWPEMPVLRQLRARYSESQLALIGISSDERLDRLEDVIQAENLNWPHIRQPMERHDNRLEPGPIAKLYNAQFIPRAFVIDNAGCIVANNARGTELLETVGSILGPSA